MLKTMLFSGQSGSGSWAATIGGSGTTIGYSVAVAPDGSVYICGSTSTDGVLVKYSADGTLIWQRTIGGSGETKGYSVAIAPDGSVYICGSTGENNDSDIFLSKFNYAGILLWRRGIDLGNVSAVNYSSVAVAPDGSVYVCCSSRNGYVRYDDVLIVKYASTGTRSWQKNLGTSVYDYLTNFNTICTDKDGFIYIGLTSGWPSSGSSYDSYVAKCNSSGTLLWGIGRNTTYFDNCMGVNTAPDGSIYSLRYDNTVVDNVLGKINQNGELYWEKKLNNSYMLCRCVAVAPDGSVYVCGSTNTDAVLAKYDADGTLIWQRTIGGSGTTIGYSVAIAPDGSVYICGSTSDDAVLVKLNEDLISATSNKKVNFGNLYVQPTDIFYSENATSSSTEDRTIQSVTSNFSVYTPSLNSYTSSLISTLYKG